MASLEPPGDPESGAGLVGKTRRVRKSHNDIAEAGTRMKMSLSKLVLAMPIERAGFAIVELGARAALRLPHMNRMGFHYILRGELVIEGPDGDHQRLVAGDFVCLPRGAAHGLSGTCATGRAIPVDYLANLAASEEPSRHHFGAPGDPGCVFLSGSLQTLRTAGAYTVPTLPDMAVLHAGADRTSSFAAPEMFEAALSGAGASAFASALAQLLFTQAVRKTVTGSPASLRPDIYAFRFPRIASAHRLMERHYHEPWSVRSLAEAVGMARSSFVTAFTAAIGEPPLTRLAAIRLSEAKRLLGGDRPIAEIAASVGYRSQAAFTRAFRRHFGETPSAVRHHLTSQLPII